MPSKETIVETPPSPVSPSLKWALFILALLLIGLLSWMVWGSNKATDTADNTAPSVKEATTETTKVAETKTYTDEKNGFSFKYPTSFFVRNDTTAASDDTTLTDVMVSVSTISTALEADGACGSTSKALLQAQKTAFEAAKVGASFDTAFKTTNFGVKMSEIISASGGTKFARGFDTCHGVVEETDPVQYRFIARTFNGDSVVTVSATAPLADSGSVTPKTEEAQIAKLDAGTNTSVAQTIYNNFNQLLDSFAFTK